MKLFLLFGICFLACFHESFQMAIIGKNNHNRIPPPFHHQKEKIGSHGVRAIGDATGEDVKTSGIGEGVFVDQDAEVQLVKRGWFDNLRKNLPDKFGRVHRAVREETPIGDPAATKTENVLVGKNTDFDLEKELNADSSEIEKESEIQIAKRGWFKKLWNKIKGVVGGLIGNLIASRSLPENAFENEPIDAILPDDIIEVDLGTDEKPSAGVDTKKEINLVKRKWLERIGRGVSVSVTWSNFFKRESDPTNKLPQNKLPLLLKTLRLRPGTADEITKIVEELGKNREFQDKMIKEVLEDKEDFEVATTDGKGKRKCRLIGRRIVCRRV